MSETKNVSLFFADFLKSNWSFGCLEKKDDPHSFCISEITDSKTCLDKCLKSPAWENPSTSNIVNVLKHCRNLHHITFIKFIDHCRVNWVGKSPSYWHENSWDCLLTHCLPMKSILFLIETIYRYQFRWNYLRNKKLSVNFLLHFPSLTEILNVLNKKITPIGFLLRKLETRKTWLGKGIKSPVWEDFPSSNMVNIPKHCSNLHDITFIIFIHHWEVNWVGKSPSYWHVKSWNYLLTDLLLIKSILFLIETI